MLFEPFEIAFYVFKMNCEHFGFLNCGFLFLLLSFERGSSNERKKTYLVDAAIYKIHIKAHMAFSMLMSLFNLILSVVAGVVFFSFLGFGKLVQKLVK